MDKRGTGMSDRFGGFLPLPEHVDDVIAVMDAVGSVASPSSASWTARPLDCSRQTRAERVIGLATYTMLPVG